MRNAGSQLPRWTAALIPLAGVVLGAIGPAKMLRRKGNTAQKETQRMPGRAAFFLLLNGRHSTM